MFNKVDMHFQDLKLTALRWPFLGAACDSFSHGFIGRNCQNAANFLQKCNKGNKYKAEG